MAVSAGRLGPGQQRWAAVLSAGEGAVLAGLSAAQASGLRFASRRLIIDILVPSSHRVLRFPGHLMTTNPDLVMAQVRAALVAAGWRE